MYDLKEQLKTTLTELDDLISDVEDNDELDEDSRAEIIEALEDAMSFVSDAILVLP